MDWQSQLALFKDLGVRLCKWALEQEEDLASVIPDDWQAILNTVASEVDGQFLVQWSSYWVANLMPYVDVELKLAASFACTSAASVEDLQPPWNAFVLRIPPGLLKLKAGHVEEDVRLVRVFYLNERWSVFVSSDSLQLWERGMTEDMFLERQRIPAVSPDDDLFPTTPYDRRVALAAVRLARGAVLWLVDAERREAAVAGRSSKVRKAWARKHPRVPSDLTRFALRAPIRVDCREAVRDWIAGSGRQATVRWLRRGHLRRQAHGPGRTLRKTIHIEPHWCGPEGAPLTIRKHQLKGDDA